MLGWACPLSDELLPDTSLRLTAPIDASSVCGLAQSIHVAARTAARSSIQSIDRIDRSN
jgi:hypothetical protein